MLLTAEPQTLIPFSIFTAYSTMSLNTSLSVLLFADIGVEQGQIQCAAVC